VLGIGADDVFVFVDAWKQSVVDDPALFALPEKRLEVVLQVCRSTYGSLPLRVDSLSSPCC